MSSVKAFSEYEEKIIHFLAEKLISQEPAEVHVAEWPEHESKSENEIWEILDRFERIGLIEIISESGTCIPKGALLIESREIKHFQTHEPKGFFATIGGGIGKVFKVFEIIANIFGSH